MAVGEWVERKRYPEETVLIAGKEYAVAEMKKEEVDIFVAELEQICKYINPAEAEIIAHMSPITLDLVRAVKKETKQPFKGYKARGNELTVVKIAARHIRTDLSPTRDTWLKSYTTVGWADYLASATSPRTMTEQTAEIIGGFTNRIDVPKVNLFRYVKDGDPYTTETIEMENVQEAHDFGVVELKQPLVIPPLSNYYIRVFAYATGDDRMAPVMLKVYRARDIMVEI